MRHKIFKTLNSIYSDTNIYRGTKSTFGHIFVRLDNVLHFGESLQKIVIFHVEFFVLMKISRMNISGPSSVDDGVDRLLSLRIVRQKRGEFFQPKERTVLMKMGKSIGLRKPLGVQF